MTARLERILDKLAERHAPRLVAAGWNTPPDDSIARIQSKARKLATVDLVVITGHLAAEYVSLQDLHIQDWVQCHYLFYHALAHALFPSYVDFDAYYADKRLPPVVALHGQATPVMEVLAGLVVPYIALRQGRGATDEPGIAALMDAVLVALAADDLPQDAYHRLHEQGVDLLRRLLNTSIQHVSLTRFDGPVPGWLRQEAVPRPATLPEESRLSVDSDSQLLAHHLETLPEDDQSPEATAEMFINEINVGPRGNAHSSPPSTLPGLTKSSAQNQEREL